MKRVIAAFVIVIAASSGPAFAQQPAKSPTDSTAKPVPAESSTVTPHSVTIDGQVIKYSARAGNLLLKNDSSDVIGSMFYVAYTKDGADLKRRPVTFVFNGGPGSSSVWLHLGSFGPVRVVTSDAEPTPPAPYTVADNPSSLLDRTDLVFIDAMGTGFSKIVGKGKPKDFFGTDEDIKAFGDFILRYATVYGRWNSPKYLLGESYGTTRAAGLANALDGRGMPMNGLVLVSSWLNPYVDFGSPPFSLEITYQLYLPTMAATAWYHHALPHEHASLPAFLDEVRDFAMNEYQHALNQGSRLGDAERDAVAAKLHEYTGLSTEFILRARLRITADRFQKELLRGKQRTVGRLDARFKGVDHDAAGEGPEYDAADVAVNGAFTSAFNQYIQGDLHFDGGTTYLTSNYPFVGADWDHRHRVAGGRWPIADVSEDLRQAMSKNPHLRIFSANGYYDFATPFFETEYTLRHMGLDPSLEKNISYGYYESGHMIYLHPAALVQMKRDLGAFYDQGQGK